MSWPDVKKINSDLNTPLNEGGVKIVKSVQRGYVGGNASADVTVAISPVDTTKCLVSLEFGSSVGVFDGSVYSVGCVGSNYSLQADTLTLSNSGTKNYNNTVNAKISWQIVEFY